VVHSCLHALQQ